MNQSKIESMEKNIAERTLDCIERLEYEFDLECLYEPYIHYIGRNRDIGDLGLSKRLYVKAKECQEEGVSMYINSSDTILIYKNSLNHIGEEASHFVHISNSKMAHTHSFKDLVFKKAIIEMFGYFGSMVVGAQRTNPYQDEVEPEKYDDFMDLVYHQGYGLGERLFYAYDDGRISKERIRRIMTNPFVGPQSATRTFLKLKREFWEE